MNIRTKIFMKIRIYNTRVRLNLVFRTSSVHWQLASAVYTLDKFSVSRQFLRRCGLNKTSLTFRRPQR